MSDEHWRDCDSYIHVYIYSCNNLVFVKEKISPWTSISGELMPYQSILYIILMFEKL